MDLVNVTNKSMTIFRQERDSAILPVKAHSTDSGYDLFTPTDFEVLVIQPMERQVVDTGIVVELPKPSNDFIFEGQIRSKSGRAAKEGLVVLNSPGTVDYGYEDTLKIILINFGSREVTIEPAQKIAQLVVCPVLNIERVMDSSDVVLQRGVALPEQEHQKKRGKGGLGSTGLSV
jgi:dUTP pyrophosphatase